MLFDRVIVFDNYRQKLILITGVKLEGDLEENYANAKQELEEMERLIRKRGAGRFPTTGFRRSVPSGSG